MACYVPLFSFIVLWLKQGIMQLACHAPPFRYSCKFLHTHSVVCQLSVGHFKFME